MMQIYEKFPRLASNNVSQRIKTYLCSVKGNKGSAQAGVKLTNKK